MNTKSDNVSAEEVLEMMKEAKEKREKMKKMYRKQRMLNRGRELLNED